MAEPKEALSQWPAKIAADVGNVNLAYQKASQALATAAEVLGAAKQQWEDAVAMMNECQCNAENLLTEIRTESFTRAREEE